MEKKRYWLKLDKDFLKSSQIKVIKNMPNGKDYIIFYLSLLLESVETVGHLRFSELVPYSDEMLASVTDTNVDIVRVAMKIFIELGLVEVLDDKTIFMTQVAQMTGKESESAERVRQFRLRQKRAKEILPTLQCNNQVTDSNTEVTKSNDNKEKKKDKQRTENKENKQSTETEKKEESVSGSVSEAELNDFFKTFEIKSEEKKILIRKYLDYGMSLEVIENGLKIPYNRNAENYDFENETVPIQDPESYGYTILNNWYNFNVKTLDDVKKYNKLNRNMEEMLGSGINKE